MSAVDEIVKTPGRPQRALSVLARLRLSPRFWIYLSCTVVAVLVSGFLGKEMMWDTLDYHFYAGFSALHDRFGRDYFAAGAQSYFNPYVYVPFYALVRSGLPAVYVAAILAVAQSAILWLSYELATALCAGDKPRTRIALGVCAVMLAAANPILISQLGSSYADITTAEVVLAGWLLLVHAVRAPSAARVVAAGALLGAASALKLTNSVHAVSACVLLLFLPGSGRNKLRLALGFGGALAISFLAITAPWALTLERHFGNPFFPLLNGIFRSPQFPAVSVLDYRFIPASVVAALWRPFAIALPLTSVDDEYAAPDLRYALLAVLAILALAQWGVRRMRKSPESSGSIAPAGASRPLIALGCAFLLDWVLWLRACGNGRYFIPMACVAGVLVVVLLFRAFAARPKALAYLLVAMFALQTLQLALGARYRQSVAWDGGPWFQVSVPRALAERPDLYFFVGEQSESFLAPWLAKGSGFIDLEGDYALGPNGANGAQVETLVQEHAPHLRVAVLKSPYVHSDAARLPHPSDVDDALAPFGLRADTTDCATVTVRNMRRPWRNVLTDTLPIRLPQIKSTMIRVRQSANGYLVTCRVVSDPGSRVALADAERGPNLVFDRVEDACPQLFQPSRPMTQAFGNGKTGYVWLRKYTSTNLALAIVGGSVRLADGVRGGQPEYLGRESAWEKAPLALACERRGASYRAWLTSSAR